MNDRQNVADFREVMRRAYKLQKKKGVMQGDQTKKLDKLFSMGQNQRCVDRDGQVLFFWRAFRRRAARLYARQNGTRVVRQLDWNSLWSWILENWKLIIRAIFFLVPFII